MFYVVIMDHNGQHFVTEVDAESAGLALHAVSTKIANFATIKCDLVHKNNKAKVIVIFRGPVTLTVGDE